MKAKWLLLINILLCFNAVWGFQSGTFINKTPPENTETVEGQALVYNFNFGKYENRDFVKIYNGKYADGYMEKGETDFIEKVMEIIEIFDNKHVDILIQYFGHIPYDKINVYFCDIRDDYKIRSGTYYAGYFDSYIKAHHNALFIDLYPTFTFESVKQIKGIISHEFQHLLHHYYDSSEHKWLNEGMSEVATYLVGGENEVHINEFIKNPFTSINYWDDRLEDYGKTYLFFRYMVYRKGTDILYQIMQCPLKGVASIQHIMGRDGWNRFFAEWASAAAINTPDILKYNFVGLDFKLSAEGIFKGGEYIPVKIEPYSFKFYDIKIDVLNNSPILIQNRTKSDLILKIAFYKKNKLVEVIEYEKGKMVYNSEFYDKIKLIAANPGRDIIEDELFLRNTIPEVKVVQNPYYFDSRMFVLKGLEFINFNFNGKKMNYFKNSSDEFFISDRIELLNSNLIEYEYIFDDKLHKGKIKFNPGEI
ncbi:MAG: hypothetical protein WC002_08425 [Candidatus Muiribacteriota bacterium]